MSSKAEEGPLRVLRVGELPPEAAERPAWLIEELWADEAVGLVLFSFVP